MTLLILGGGAWDGRATEPRTYKSVGRAIDAGVVIVAGDPLEDRRTSGRKWASEIAVDPHQRLGERTMRLSDFDALSFDCYGTLIDWESGILAVLVPWAKQHRLGIDHETLLATFAQQEAAAEARTPDARYPEVLARSFIGVGHEFNAPVLGEDAQRLASSVPDWPAFPDSHDALTSLAKRYRLFILSNVDRESFGASNEKLDVCFAGIVTAEDVGSYKPSKRNFEALLTHVGLNGVQPGRLLHVAQSLFHDHVPAKTVGLPTVWIDRRGERDGWGATPPPPIKAAPDWMFPSMAAFAARVSNETRGHQRITQ